MLRFVEDDLDRECLEVEVVQNLASLLLQTGRYEEAGPLIRRILKPGTSATPNFNREVLARSLSVRFQVERRCVEQAVLEMKVPPISSTR